jgi:spermidine/putrescine transport system ATP-binding protein
MASYFTSQIPIVIKRQNNENICINKPWKGMVIYMKLQLSDIQIKFDNQFILKSIELQVPEGAFTTIFGPSGSGKSTLLKIISGLLKAEKGSILLDGHDVTHVAAHKRRISHVYQEPFLFPHLTVEENIAFGMEVQKFPKEEIKKKIKFLLELMQLEGFEKRRVQELSGGQKQRVSIARALAPNPSLILLDEPFSGLDYSLREEMGLLLKDLQKKLNLTVLFVTHQVEECIRLSDTVILMDQGEILQLGYAKEVYEYPNSVKSGKLMGKGNWLDDDFRNKFCKKSEQKLFVRPHKIKLEKGRVESIFQITNVIEKGKILEITVFGYGQELIVETFGQESWSVGEFVDVEIME